MVSARSYLVSSNVSSIISTIAVVVGSYVGVSSGLLFMAVSFVGSVSFCDVVVVIAAAIATGVDLRASSKAMICVVFVGSGAAVATNALAGSYFRL